MTERIAFLGAGTMGEALLAGMLRAGRAPAELLFSERDEQRRTTVEQRHHVRAVPAEQAAREADTLVLAVKPQEIAGLLAEIQVPADTLVVSIAAGITTGVLESHLPAGVPVVRVMPNTPALVGAAMSVLSAGAHAQEEHLARAEGLLAPVGKVLRLPESQLDAVTALSGSGPAYFFYVVEAMIDAGVLLGLPRAVATELVVQTAYGAAAMLRDTGEHPALLREAVTSPGGTTIAGVRELERHGTRAAVIAAAEAARNRSQELGG